MNSSLLNHGIVIIGEKPLDTYRTVIVLGSGRGGTSACASALNHLGIFTGNESQSPTYEDVLLSRHLESGNFEAVREVISSYNAKYSIWGYKRPSANALILQNLNLFRNPIFLIVFRDLLSIANRNAISMNAELFSTMRRTITEYKNIVDFLENCTPYALLVSYEKLCNNKVNFVNELVLFLGIEHQVHAEHIKNAIDSIKQDSRTYIEGTNAVAHYGYLDSADVKRASGWAAYNQTSDPVQLELFHNDQRIMDFSPSDFRKDVMEKKLHPTGYCAFNKNYPPGVNARAGDRISVRFKNTNQELRGSPKVIE